METSEDAHLFRLIISLVDHCQQQQHYRLFYQVYLPHLRLLLGKNQILLQSQDSIDQIKEDNNNSAHFNNTVGKSTCIEIVFEAFSELVVGRIPR